MFPTIPATPPVPAPVSALPAMVPPASPLSAGLRAAKANLIPGLCLQAAMLAVVFAYYRMPLARPWFDRLGALKQDFSYAFTVVLAVVAGALLPEFFKWCFLRRRLPVWSDAGDFLFAAGFYTANALCVDRFYRWQAAWFGNGVTLPVITQKVLVDQFIYNPLFSAPFAVVCFAWKNHKYSLKDTSDSLTPPLYGKRVLPTLLATWFVWIPVVTVLYSLPPLLQIPIYSFALCFWALMLAYIHAQPNPAAEPLIAQATKKKASASNT